MAANAVAVRDDQWAVLEKVVMSGDLSKLSAQDRVAYVRQLTESLGMNPNTQPFQYMSLQNKLTLYATKNAAEQLRKLNGVSIDAIEKEMMGDAYVVTIYGHDQHDRRDSDMGVVSIKGLAGDALANAMMKCITKAKRRFTLSICGLGFLDESEVETIPGARLVQVDEDGVIVDKVRELPPPAPQRPAAPPPSTLPQTRNKARVVEEVPAPVKPNLNHLWGLAQKYYGKDGAGGALHKWISVDYPEAQVDGKPSLRALTQEQVDTMVAELEKGIRDDAEAAAQSAETTEPAAE